MGMAIVVMAILFLMPWHACAYDLDMAKKDVEAFLNAVRGTRTLEQFHYFQGEGCESELEFELKACTVHGVETSSEQCVAYTRCRWEKQEQVQSYYFSALSQILPAGKVETVQVRQGDEDSLPHVIVQALVGGHTLTFFKPTRAQDYVQFGRLSLTLIDGKRFDLSKRIDFDPRPDLAPCINELPDIP